jgi:hypothetical protein
MFKMKQKNVFLKFHEITNRRQKLSRTNLMKTHFESKRKINMERKNPDKFNKNFKKMKQKIYNKI